MSLSLTLMSAALAALATPPAHADSVEDFYKANIFSHHRLQRGRRAMTSMAAAGTATWQIHPGQADDRAAEHTGAGSFRARASLRRGAKDGTVFGTFGRTIATMPLLGRSARARCDQAHLARERH